APEPHPAGRSVLARVLSAGQFVIALGLTLAALAYLLLHPGAKPDIAEDRPAAKEDSVRLAAPGLIRVTPDTPLAKKLDAGAAAVQATRITAPVLTVTGTVAASLRPGSGKGKDYWQFNAPEALTAYTDWQKAKADIVFARAQRDAVNELVLARLSAQEKAIERLKRLVEAGTDTEKDLAVARADLLQAQIQGRKDAYEADTAILVANRNEAALARQLQQIGLDPALLTSATADVDVVIADVPETALGRVKVGQGCEARFFSIPDRVFPGKVNSVAPVLSKERRSIRVLFTIADPDDQLRPGMFADIGLGTDAREALLVPADGVVHVGRHDYLLVAAGESGAWRVTEADIGEARGDRVEVLKGLAAGDRVAGTGAVLLKPLVAQAVRAGRAASGGAQ
ncbi:MAG TPA: efflux RND transporter periplasmic adaptor subunit, partial [Urbifossiella sp.]|nr:efflux RND transporter periplasmic adaptor subunit [Urbifossiella sp.]